MSKTRVEVEKSQPVFVYWINEMSSLGNSMNKE